MKDQKPFENPQSQSHKPLVLLFGRVPQYGRGKRRLAKDLGNAQAWLFARRNLQASLQRLHDPRWRLKLAATPDALTRNRTNHLPQGQGDLGQRLMRHLRTRNSTSRALLVVGADIPNLSARDLTLALKGLAAKKPSWALALMAASGALACAVRSGPSFHRT